jgi:hypothetical protein
VVKRCGDQVEEGDGIHCACKIWHYYTKSPIPIPPERRESVDDMYFIDMRKYLAMRKKHTGEIYI